MNAKRIFDILTVIFAIIVLAVICLHSCQRQKLSWEIQSFQKDMKRVQDELTKRNAGDCVMERTDYGYKCTEKSGKVFKVIL